MDQKESEVLPDQKTKRVATVSSHVPSQGTYFIAAHVAVLALIVIPHVRYP